MSELRVGHNEVFRQPCATQQAANAASLEGGGVQVSGKITYVIVR